MTDVTVTGLTIRPLKGAVTEIKEAAVNMAVGEVLCRLNADGKLALADADADSTSKGQLALRVANNPVRAAGTVVAGDWCTVVLFGPVAGFTGLDEEKQLFMSGTAGKIADAAGTVVRAVGYPLSETEINFQPGDNRTSA